jgi:glycine cleavage system H lipoate-binding protein
MSKIWTLVEGNYTKVGFEKDFLKQMEQCWHIMPAQARGVLKAKHPLLVVETNDEVISIPSPVEGIIEMFSDKARNFPEKITEKDTIIIIKTVYEKKDLKQKQVAERAQAVPRFNPIEALDQADAAFRIQRNAAGIPDNNAFLNPGFVEAAIPQPVRREVRLPNGEIVRVGGNQPLEFVRANPNEPGPF